jgi:hypothetical protein
VKVKVGFKVKVGLGVIKVIRTLVALGVISSSKGQKSSNERN